MITREIIVRGKVQGVFFRASVKEVADRLGITGRVKNLPDGAVGLVTTGTGDAMEKMLAWCKEGPPREQVDEVEMKEVNDPGYTDFRIVRD